MKKKKQYKLWVHIETFIDGEPVEGNDEDPRPVRVNFDGTDPYLVSTRQKAEFMRDNLCG